MRRFFRVLALISAFLTAYANAAAPSTVDYAGASHVDDWLRHPVLGDPSFDAFARPAGNPIRRGKPPFDWPVNGFLFRDPPSGDWYVYVGDYARGYLGTPARCWVMRSRDAGKSWEDVGEVLPRDPKTFDGDGKRSGYMPDVSVVYDAAGDKRYHMLYDWGRADATGLNDADGGIAYAVADKPDGPFARDREPIQRHTTTKLLFGRYNRPYAQTLIRRKDDWLILADMDHAPNSWAIYAMTSKQARGPYGDPVLVRHVETDYFHPPLMEGYPAFVHDGFVYAPTTSVARTRNYNCIFRAPLERAQEESAWELWRHGSVWHSDDVENEHFGIWGQTFSAFVIADDQVAVLHAMFPSRDRGGFGTINLASRRWDTPMRKTGFHLSGNGGPSLTLLRKTYGDFEMNVGMKLRGTVRLMWDHHAPLGPNVLTSDATPHAISMTRHSGLRLRSDGSWEVSTIDDAGKVASLASGTLAKSSDRNVRLARRGDEVTVSIDDKKIWMGKGPTVPGGIGLAVNDDSHVDVTRFQITGDAKPATRSYFYTDALLGHGEAEGDWQIVRDDKTFRFGAGAESKFDGQTVKWNVTGKRLRLWSPSGPRYGKVNLRLDGKDVGVVDLHSPENAKSSVVWSSDTLTGDYHALVVRAQDGNRFAVDSLDAED